MITVEQFNETGFKPSSIKWFADMEDYIKANPSEETEVRRAMEVRRKPETIVGFLTKEAAWDLVQNHDSEAMINCGLVLVSDGNAFFLSDDHQLGWGVLPKQFVACSFKLPLFARGKYVTSIDEFCDAYCSGRGRRSEPELYLDSVEAIVNYVNENYHGGPYGAQGN